MKKVIDYFDSISKHVVNIIHRSPYETYRNYSITKGILSLIPDKENLVILDIGCGTGEFLIKPLLQRLRSPKITGIDLSREAVKICSENFPSCKINIGNTQKMSFKDGSFDLVISREVIEHLFQPIIALREMRRVLKNNGIVIVSTPSWFGPIGPFYFLKKLLGGMEPIINNWWTHFSLRKALIKTGFRTKSSHGVNPMPYHERLPSLFAPFIKNLDKILLHTLCEVSG